MKVNFGLATLAVIGASAGAGALDAVPHMVGGYEDLTRLVLAECATLHALGDPIQFDGGGSALGESALKELGANSTQMIAPMTRPLGMATCVGLTQAQRSGAEQLVIALQAATLAVNPSTAGAEGIDYTGNAGDPANEWRRVLRLVYAGMDTAAGSNLFLRDCDSVARNEIVNNWDNVFRGTVTACTDSHPSVLGSGAAGYDPSNSIVEPGIRHAFRRDDSAGTTDVFLSQLGLPSINFAQAAPAGANAVQTAVYRALAGSAFCNDKRPDDDWAPVTLAAKGALGFNASQIPEMTQVGTPLGAGTGLGFSTQLKGSANPKNMSPYLTEYTDQDPIRRRCVGRGNNANAALPFEQVCSADGTLGVVLPITIPAELTVSERFPSLPCEPGKGFFFGPALTRPTTDPLRCPNGDATQDGQCLLPVRTDATQPNGVAFDCINPPGNVPQAVFDTDGDGSQFTDAPATDGRTDVDGRVYNLILRKPSGEVRTVLRRDPSRLGVFQMPVAAAYYRIHGSRSLGLPPAHTRNICAQHDAGDQINCLTTASPCSIGLSTLDSALSHFDWAYASINGIPASRETVRNLVRGGAKWPIARKVYLNTLQGFEALNGSSASVPATDAEEELAKCYAVSPFNGTINVESPSLSFVALPPALGSPYPKPLCEDFNGRSVCGDATNSDACVGNEAIAGGAIPTSRCDNGLVDGDETGPDLCPAVRPTCNPITHHCQ